MRDEEDCLFFQGAFGFVEELGAHTQIDKPKYPEMLKGSSQRSSRERA